MEKIDTRQEIIKIINSMPEYEIPIVLDHIKAMQEQTRILKSELKYAYLCSLPEEDYILSDEEKASMARGGAEIEAGRWSKWEDVVKELDM